MIKTDHMSEAKRLVMTWLSSTEVITDDEIRNKVGMVVGMLQSQYPELEVDQEELVREIEAACNVWVPNATSLDNNNDHIEWLADRRGEIQWNFWERYRRYLEDLQQLAPESVRRLDEITDEVLKRLEDSQRPGQWDRRGMVVGQVQSGKTANYIGLISKAADAGYRLIIVLAGAHNSLRSQTQLRLDQGFLGFDTQQRMQFNQNNARIGVGRLPGAEFLTAHSLTNSSETGDFSLKVASQANVMVRSHDPILLVVKKNNSILRNLIKWATFLQDQDPGTGRDMVRDVPLLVIDDEADYASINTKAIPLDEAGNPDYEEDPTKINGLIRKLLHAFQQSCYVGYTATPFANIFIPPDAGSEEYGEDLFPRDFVLNLPVPSNYVGPAQVFGLEEESLSLEEQEGMPIVRTVDDHETWMPDRHKKVHVPGSLPRSLRRAILSFILVCAARAVRGQENEHNSMLIHVTRFTNVQHQIIDQVKSELEVLQRRLRYGEGNASETLLDELQALWETDFLPTTRQFDAAVFRPIPWDEIYPVLAITASRIQVLEINGSARDALQYSEHPNGMSCIVIGGDKLSRGLTLEGLSVSYYLRASRLYDTLMQMGRWFGYRPRYMDLCRLYTTAELAEWYRDITAASEELRHEFDHMAAIGGTPQDFGLLVRKHPDGLMVTSRPKLRHGIHVKISFSGTISETIIFHRDLRTIEENYERAEYLLRNLGTGQQSGRGGAVQWHADSPDDVLTFLETFVTHQNADRARASLLARYVQDRNQDGELIEWVIRLASGARDNDLIRVGDNEVRLVTRRSFPPVESFAPEDPYRIRRLVSPADELADLDDQKRDEALERTRKDWKNSGRTEQGSEPRVPGGVAIRRVRPARRGLLLLYPLDPENAHVTGVPPIIGFATSFPWSPRAQGIDYVVNNVYWQQEFALHP